MYLQYSMGIEFICFFLTEKRNVWRGLHRYCNRELEMRVPLGMLRWEWTSYSYTLWYFERHFLHPYEYVVLQTNLSATGWNPGIWYIPTKPLAWRYSSVPHARVHCLSIIWSYVSRSHVICSLFILYIHVNKVEAWGDKMVLSLYFITSYLHYTIQKYAYHNMYMLLNVYYYICERIRLKRKVRKKERKKINKNLQLKKVGQRIPIIIFSPPYQNAPNTCCFSVFSSFIQFISLSFFFKFTIITLKCSWLYCTSFARVTNWQQHNNIIFNMEPQLSPSQLTFRVIWRFNILNSFSKFQFSF